MDEYKNSVTFSTVVFWRRNYLLDDEDIVSCGAQNVAENDLYAWVFV